MAADIDTLTTNLTANIDQFTSKMTEAQATMNARMSAIEDRQATAVKKINDTWGLLNVAKVVAALAILERAFDAAAKSFEWSAQLTRTSQLLGLSTTQLQQFGYMAIKAGLSSDQMNSAMSTLNNNLGKFMSGIGGARSAQGFQALFPKDSVAQVRAIVQGWGDLSNGLPAIADRLSLIHNHTQRIAVETKLGGTEFAMFDSELVKGGQHIKDVEAESAKLGTVMSEKDVKAASDLSEQIKIAGVEVTTNLNKAFLNTGGLIKWLMGLMVNFTSMIDKASDRLSSLTPPGAVIPHTGIFGTDVGGSTRFDTGSLHDLGDVKALLDGEVTAQAKLRDDMMMQGSRFNQTAPGAPIISQPSTNRSGAYFGATPDQNAETYRARQNYIYNLRNRERQLQSDADGAGPPGSGGTGQTLVPQAGKHAPGESPLVDPRDAQKTILEAQEQYQEALAENTDDEKKKAVYQKAALAIAAQIKEIEDQQAIDKEILGGLTKKERADMEARLSKNRNATVAAVVAVGGPKATAIQTLQIAQVWSAYTAGIKQATDDNKDTQRGLKEAADANIAAIKLQVDTTLAGLDAMKDMASSQLALAKTMADRRDLALRIFGDEEQIEEQKLLEIIAEKNVVRATDEAGKKEQAAADAAATVAQGKLDSLRATLNNRQAAVSQANPGSPLAAYQQELNNTLGPGLQDSIETMGVDAMKSFNSQISDAIVNGKSLGEVFTNIGKTIAEKLINLGLDKLTSSALNNFSGLFSGNTGGLNGGTASALAQNVIPGSSALGVGQGMLLGSNPATPMWVAMAPNAMSVLGNTPGGGGLGGLLSGLFGGGGIGGGSILNSISGIGAVSGVSAAGPLLDTSFLSALSFAADGGPASGLTVVGENGPELLDLGSGGNIMPNGLLRNLVSSASAAQSKPNIVNSSVVIHADEAVMAGTIKTWIAQSSAIAAQAAQQNTMAQLVKNQRNSFS